MTCSSSSFSGTAPGNPLNISGSASGVTEGPLSGSFLYFSGVTDGTSFVGLPAGAGGSSSGVTDSTYLLPNGASGSESASGVTSDAHTLPSDHDNETWGQILAPLSAS
jgi:hypothetical protein